MICGGIYMIPPNLCQRNYTWDLLIQLEYSKVTLKFEATWIVENLESLPPLTMVHIKSEHLKSMQPLKCDDKQIVHPQADCSSASQSVSPDDEIGEGIVWDLVRESKAIILWAKDPWSLFAVHDVT